jgi:hypothetical protein
MHREPRNKCNLLLYIKEKCITSLNLSMHLFYNYYEELEPTHQ